VWWVQSFSQSAPVVEAAGSSDRGLVALLLKGGHAVGQAPGIGEEDAGAAHLVPGERLTPRNLLERFEVGWVDGNRSGSSSARGAALLRWTWVNPSTNDGSEILASLMSGDTTLGFLAGQWLPFPLAKTAGDW
jgi:hypothetical protein